jgi:Zn-dependent protease with chaperone function
MDFFAAQAAAKRRTAVLVLWFAAAWLGTIALVYVGLRLLLSSGALGEEGRLLAFGPALLAWTAAGVTAVTASGSAFHAVRLARDGPHAVARMVGGTPVDRGTRDPAERRLVNVVEEMAIASGLPVPSVYVLAREDGINAFAAGFTPDRAVVAMTRGAIERLTRDELQGVVAHELSHVLNADSRLNLRLVALIGGITVLALVGRSLLRGLRGGRSSRGGRGRALVFATGLCVWLAGAVGAFFARVIRAAVSRQREFLADAAAAQFTRNPDALAAALAKIEAQGSAISSPLAPEASHFFFANGLRAGWLATHPPIRERIERLSPQALARAMRAPAIGTSPPVPSGAAASAGEIRIVASELAGAAAARTISATAGRPDARHVAHAAELLARLPPDVTAAARAPATARALACALLADADPAVREVQLAQVADPVVRGEAGRLAEALAGASREDRMAALDLALPALDALSREDAAALVRDAGALAAADGRTTVFEWAVQRVVRRRLAPVLGERRTRASSARARSVDDVRVEAHEVLSVLAWLGTRDESGAQRALDAGVRALGIAGAWRPLPRDRVRAATLEAALERLDGAAPATKSRLLAACAATALADRRVITAEGEVVRAIAASLGVPVPPLIPDEPGPAAEIA